MSDKKSIFGILSQIDMGQKIKTQQGHRYLSWYDVKAEIKKHFPEVKEDVKLTEFGQPYFASPLGIFVVVSVTIDDITETEFYPVLDTANRALKMESYEYTTKNGKKTVQAATSFDINTSIKRAYVKCCAGHGLGIYIFQDLPTADVETLDSSQLQAVMNKVKEKKLTLSKVCSAWNIEKPAQLWASNFDLFMDYLEQS